MKRNLYFITVFLLAVGFNSSVQACNVCMGSPGGENGPILYCVFNVIGGDECLSIVTADGDHSCYTMGSCAIDPDDPPRDSGGLNSFGSSCRSAVNSSKARRVFFPDDQLDELKSNNSEAYKLVEILRGPDGSVPVNQEINGMYYRKGSTSRDPVVFSGVIGADESGMSLDFDIEGQTHNKTILIDLVNDIEQ